jgi:hypothetical protein
VALIVDGGETARIAFKISLVFGLFETAFAAGEGRSSQSSAGLARLASLYRWPDGTALLRRQVQLRVRLLVRPPMTIPLPPAHNCSGST